MFAVLHIIVIAFANLFKIRAGGSRPENVLLRHRLNVALRRTPARLRLQGMGTAALLIGLIRLWPDLIDVIQVCEAGDRPALATAGFRAYWRWKSKRRVGRPRIDRGLRD